MKWWGTLFVFKRREARLTVPFAMNFSLYASFILPKASPEQDCNKVYCLSITVLGNGEEMVIELDILMV